MAAFALIQLATNDFKGINVLTGRKTKKETQS